MELRVSYGKRNNHHTTYISVVWVMTPFGTKVMEEHIVSIFRAEVLTLKMEAVYSFGT
jgi:hypothetical protein